MKNIVLTGFMGSGKTTVGKIIAETLNIDFIDTDSEIIKKLNLPIDEIFKRFGEEKFREVETEVTYELSQVENAVISTGGGIVLKKENIENLRKNGIIYYLHASPDIIFQRLSKDNTRPLLQNNDKLKTIIRLLNIRIPYYKNCDYEINTDNLVPEQIAKKIIEIHRKRGEIDD